jgi:hypothetical protein
MERIKTYLDRQNECYCHWKILRPNGSNGAKKDSLRQEYLSARKELLEIIEQYASSQPVTVSNEDIQKHIEFNCKNEHGEPMMDEQTFYEGAKWMKEQLTSPQPENDEWVSVHDRLPEEESDLHISEPNYSVLVQVFNGKQQFTGFCYLPSGQWMEHYSELSLSDITHWRELPNPPM